MTDPRISVMTEALYEVVGQDPLSLPECEVLATGALALVDAVDPVREAARDLLDNNPPIPALDALRDALDVTRAAVRG
jgi:hypothetical protein